jgi:hypothetical protein
MHELGYQPQRVYCFISIRGLIPPRWTRLITMADPADAVDSRHMWELVAPLQRLQGDYVHSFNWLRLRFTRWKSFPHGV